MKDTLGSRKLAQSFEKFILFLYISVRLFQKLPHLFSITYNRDLPTYGTPVSNVTRQTVFGTLLNEALKQYRIKLNNIHKFKQDDLFLFFGEEKCEIEEIEMKH